MGDQIDLYKNNDSCYREFPKVAPVDICEVLRSISDDKSLALFNTVALAADNASIAISKLKLTKKQYYSRMSALINTELVTRKHGMYFLTSFGKVVYEAHILIGRAQQNYWKLKAIDSIESSNNALTPEERDRFINSLIEDNDLKQILLSDNNKNKQLPTTQQQSMEMVTYPRQNIIS